MQVVIGVLTDVVISYPHSMNYGAEINHLFSVAVRVKGVHVTVYSLTTYRAVNCIGIYDGMLSRVLLMGRSNNRIRN